MSRNESRLEPFHVTVARALSGIKVENRVVGAMKAKTLSDLIEETKIPGKHCAEVSEVICAKLNELKSLEGGRATDEIVGHLRRAQIAVEDQLAEHLREHNGANASVDDDALDMSHQPVADTSDRYTGVSG